ncbi:MAG: putative cytosol aminopeptidase [Parachlamydiales bacterium]|nr:putative cytosol aminopeptidase [Parachlamydiales bacterium]
MLKIVCQKAFEKRELFELMVLPYWEGPGEAADLSMWKEIAVQPLASGDFNGKAGDTLLLYSQGRLLFLGLGKKDAVNGESLRRAYSAAVRLAQTKKVKTIHLVVPKIPKMADEDVLRGISEGILLTNYSFSQLKYDSLKENPVCLLEKAYFIGLEMKHEALIQKLTQIAAGVYLTRELVNGNADDVTPKMLAETALSLEKRTPGLKATILDKKQIEKEKMGLLLAVNRGSSMDPYLINLSYQGNPKSKEHIVLVGKGITYDTGGLALKPADGMATMKCDMAGAATVLAVVHTAAALQLKVNVTAVAPVTENAIDANSYKNGDVYRSMSGKTIEVNNTDAEGRLVLADAMTYAIKHWQPTKMIDVATLTGGIIIALGEEIAGVFANDDQLAKDLAISSEATGENVWRMPLHADYKEMLKSETADLLNSAGKSASSMTAALFLQEFVGSVHWAHIDFAGSSYLSKPKYYNTSKATGFGVRLLIDFLERHAT